MLILRRRAGETILVNGEVEIEVIEISRTRVKLGVRAPNNVSVMRKEAVPVARENRLASGLIADRGPAVAGEVLALLQRAANTTPTPVTPTTNAGFPPLKPERVADM